MDSYYSSPSYYYEPQCPIHDTYIEPYPTYYYPNYIDQSSSPPQIIHYNHSTPIIYNQPTPVITSTPQLGRQRRRRQRTIFSKDQVDILDQVFEKNRYPDIQLREQLSQQLDVPEARIQVWFKNRRSRTRSTTKPRQ